MAAQNKTLSRAFNDLAAYGAVVVRSFELPPHLRKLVEVLEAVERGEIDRVLISMPPRHGKSLITSQLFPAWYLGRNPTKSIIAASYGAELATGFGRKVRGYTHEKLHRLIFPDCKIADDSDSAARFSTTLGGNYYAVGVGGPITGRGADLFLFDDLIKSSEDANSPAFRRSLKDWFSSVAYPRLEPNGAIIGISTRWHEDDLHGFCLRELAEENWVVVNFPAIAETDEGWRAEGEALWPERYSLESLARIREAIGTSAWVSLYQQRPAPLEGAIFKKDWFKSYGGPVECSRTIFSLDCAFKTGKENDYSVIAIISEAKNGFYIRQISRGRWEYPDLVRQVQALYDIWRPHLVLIEDAASGQSLIQSLKAETRLPILPVKPLGDKVSRANAVSPLVESGRVCVPESAAWLADFIEEITSFPAAPHDDQTDAVCQGLNYMRGSGWDSATFQAMAHAHAAYMAQRRRVAPSFYNNVNDMLAAEDGPTVRGGSRYTIASRVGRGLRGF